MFRIKNNSLSAGAQLYFDDFITRDGWEAAQRHAQPQLSVLPATNVVETADAFLIELVAPGLTHEDLDISIRDNEVELRFNPADSAFESIQNRREWRSEYRLLPFHRSFELNEELLDLEAMEVSSSGGIIHVSIPKRENVRGRIMLVMPFSLN